MAIEEVLKAISTVGFPIVISIYTLVKMDKTIETMNGTLIKLTSIIEQNMKGE